MKSCFFFLALLAFSGSIYAQRYLPSQRGFMIQYGFVNAPAFSNKDNSGSLLSAGWSVINQKRAHLGLGIDYQRQSFRRNGQRLPLEFFLASADFNPLLVCDHGRVVFLSLNLGVHGGYERINKGSKTGIDSLRNDAFVFGPHIGLEAELFLSDRFALVATGKEKLLLRVREARKMQSVFGIGVKFIFNKGW